MSLKEIIAQYIDLREILARLRMDPRIKLYDTAYNHLGSDVSPNDVAPDEYGCAESVYALLLSTGIRLNPGGGPIVSTIALEAALRASGNFERVVSPLPGDIVISPSSTTPAGLVHGHTGICGKHWIMSNSSQTGTFEANFTLDGWYRYYRDKLGLPVLFYRLLPGRF